jgi:hypothetical protein
MGALVDNIVHFPTHFSKSYRLLAAELQQESGSLAVFCGFLYDVDGYERPCAIIAINGNACVHK